jgi:enoyl-CoA hydratase
MEALVDLAVADRVATFTLNRPEARNALSGAMRDRLVELFDWFESTDEADVGVLTAVDPVFSAGLDLKELEPGGGYDLPTLNEQGNIFPSRSKPLVGAINGPAVTGGLELALSCDVLVASDRARFADTHARVGVVPFWGMSVRLPQAVGQRMANYMSLTGNFIDADTALRAGLVAMVVPHDELAQTAAKVAGDIASTDQAAMRELLRLYRDNSDDTTAGSYARELERSKAWHAGFDADEMSRRRQAVTERGRAQA